MKESKQALNFQIMEDDGSIRDAKCIEEFVNAVKDFKVPLEKTFDISINDEYFSKTDAVSSVQ